MCKAVPGLLRGAEPGKQALPPDAVGHLGGPGHPGHRAFEWRGEPPFTEGAAKLFRSEVSWEGTDVHNAVILEGTTPWCGARVPAVSVGVPPRWGGTPWVL